MHGRARSRTPCKTAWADYELGNPYCFDLTALANSKRSSEDMNSAARDAQEQARKPQCQVAQTATYLATAVFAAALTPPLLTYVVVY
jgi:hypothetical protein